MADEANQVKADLLEQEWLGFEKAVLPSEAGTIQRKECGWPSMAAPRRCFTR